MNGGGSLVFLDGGLANLAASNRIARALGRVWLGVDHDSGRGLTWSG